MKITIGIADDHRLFLKSLSALIDSFSSFQIIVEALNGSDLIRQLSLNTGIPDLLLIDVDMPEMNGQETVMEVSTRWPSVKCIALSMKNDDRTIISMLKAGCCAYLLKDIDPHDLEKALHEVHTKGYYNADASNLNYRRFILKSKEEEKLQLNDREILFLQLACSDRTYKQIASEMNLSERTIDGYRETVFQKFNVQSRVGMALEAIRRNLVEL
jgi:DNA-binding NarL/FixJ family response regulator